MIRVYPPHEATYFLLFTFLNLDSVMAEWQIQESGVSASTMHYYTGSIYLILK